MEAFSYQHNNPSFFDDQVYFQHSPIEMPFISHQVGDMSNASSCYNSSDIELQPTPQASSENKRKQSDGSCLSTGQSKGGNKGSRIRKQKKAMNDELKAKSKELKATSDQDPPSGYIHVRARRGQATDSHSLAERVRRERISERMKKLQGLVPGCDKVTGKALVLDEIINYVQSLQNQVEFLSMKLASANPIIYDFAADYAELMIQPEPSAIQQTPPTTFGGTTSNSIAFSLEGEGPTNYSQNGGNYIMQVGDHTARGFASPADQFHNMCSFH